MHAAERKLVASADRSILQDALASVSAAMAAESARAEAAVLSRYAERFAALAASSNTQDRAHALARLQSEHHAEIAALKALNLSRSRQQRQVTAHVYRHAAKRRMQGLTQRQRLERASVGLVARSLKLLNPTLRRKKRLAISSSTLRRFALSGPQHR